MKNIYKPILFGTDMVQANLSGRKTQTRRIIKSKFGQCMFCGCVDTDCTQCIEKTGTACYWVDDTYTVCSACSDLKNTSKAKYQIGDILWVRESFCFQGSDDNVLYKVNHPEKDYSHRPIGGWKPSIHMPKGAARIFIYVTNVRAERLQDISEADAIAEGIERQKTNYGDYLFKHYLKDKFGPSAKHSFQTLWQKINGIESWDKNPYVWVYEYERIEKPKDFI
ncbi:hypothetical protein [Paenimyroides baculatum]|uniref:Uncharacterized protein n=1 Tax=Paenimyroides baculatum TaxID=2608000 RepID=A0A5M6CC62_9FLAO|nr:hypothetical protein [Paenimyroides baculatum]KAA5532788.1 hypothetical protein F0460_13160 [Paenimyroides baculatum]